MSNSLIGHPVTRRHAIQLGLFGAAGLMLSDWFALKAAGAINPLKARAKSVIQVWLWGGPSHLDTFDPKPGAGYDYYGKFDKPLATNVDGVQIGQLMPQLAKMADKYALLRGMTHGNNGHETASYMIMTGTKPVDGVVNPSVGSVVSYKKGYGAGYEGLIPPYVALTRPQGRFSESGFLGSKYQPFATGGDPAKTPFAVEGVVAAGITEARQQGRRTLLGDLDTFARAMEGSQLIDRMDKNKQDAYSLILGKAKETFDLSKEPDELRAAYGRNTFGQSCLQARKLVEAGVPFVTINFNGWDTHKKNFDELGRMVPMLDGGLAMLLKDLSDRGLLDTTIVWCGGEFGRTPKVDWTAPWNGGRGHYGKAFSHLIAGGGFTGGRVVGATNARGEEVINRPIYPWDLAASVYELMGIDPNSPLPTPDGKTAYFSPLADGSKIESGGLLREIMA
ncbi:MAG: DUF1501 domain-containing protein [Kiritimatiellaceae bacterium]|nr:DUF1501 domain-containing protein [Kiritimatiellaceae bacterium]